MKYFILSILTASAAVAQPLNFEWFRSYNSGGNGADYASVIAVDTNGNVFVSGSTSAANAPRATNAFVLIKYSSTGLPLWTNRYVDPLRITHPAALALDKNGNVFVTGTSHSGSSGPDFATIAFNNDGLPLWTNRYTSSSNQEDSPLAMEVDQTGNIYVIGFSWSLGSPVEGNYATIKYSNTGAPLWTNVFAAIGGFPGADSLISIDQEGNVLLAGASEGANGFSDFVSIKLTSSGIPLWTNRYNGPGDHTDLPVGIVTDRAGTAFVTGTSYQGTLSNGFDIATIAYSAEGTPLWTNRFNGPGSAWDYARAIAINTHGEIFVTGDAPTTSSGPPSFATIAYSGAGAPLWTNYYTAGNDNGVAAMALDSNENIIVTGYSVGIGTGADLATIKYSRSGRAISTNRYNGSFNSADYSYAVTIGESADVFVAGMVHEPFSGTDFATIKYSTLKPIPLLIEKAPGSAILTWSNALFQLRAAPNLTSPFTNVPTATSPYTNLNTTAQQFFQLVAE